MSSGLSFCWTVPPVSIFWYCLYGPLPFICIISFCYIYPINSFRDFLKFGIKTKRTLDSTSFFWFLNSLFLLMVLLYTISAYLSITFFVIFKYSEYYDFRCQNLDYGLFRATHFHSPPPHSQSMGPLPHFLLMCGRVNKVSLHLHASMTWRIPFDTVIILFLFQKILAILSVA